MGLSRWGAETEPGGRVEPLPNCSSLFYPHSEASGFPTGIGWTAAYSGSYSTLVVPLQMLPGLEGKLVRCRTERIGR